MELIQAVSRYEIAPADQGQLEFGGLAHVNLAFAQAGQESLVYSGQDFEKRFLHGTKIKKRPKPGAFESFAERSFFRKKNRLLLRGDDNNPIAGLFSIFFNGLASL